MSASVIEINNLNDQVIIISQQFLVWLPTSSFFDMKVILRLYGAPLFGSLPRYLASHYLITILLPIYRKFTKLIQIGTLQLSIRESHHKKPTSLSPPQAMHRVQLGCQSSPPYIMEVGYFHITKNLAQL